jgi:putative transport protein
MFQWMEVLAQGPVAQAILALSLVAAFGLALGSLPSLAAAQAALQSLPGQNQGSGDLLGMAYAVAYPFGIVGIILTMVLARKVFSIDIDAEARNVEVSAQASARAPDFIDLEIYQPERGWAGVAGDPVCRGSRRRLLAITPEREGDRA